MAQAKCSLICRNLDIRNSEPSVQWYFIGVVSCGCARELRRSGFSLLFVCRASSQRPTIERIQSHCCTQAMTCVSSHSPFYSVPFILSKRAVRLSRCGWRRFYLLNALVRARSTGGPFVLPLASLPMHTVSGASYFVATEKRSNDVATGASITTQLRATTTLVAMNRQRRLGKPLLESK
jgi:hypothetical protein